MTTSTHRGSIVRGGLVVAALVAGMIGGPAATASGDPANISVTKINGQVVDTGIPTTCARVGTGPGTNVNAHWLNVPLAYAATTADLTCAHQIAAFMQQLAYDEANYSATVPQQLRSALLSGTVNLSKPYEVFLDNIYVTTTAIATLEVTAPGSPAGLGSCGFADYMVLVTCNDNELGSVILRDDWGNPYRDWAGNPISFNLNGLLSQRGGTTYGNLFLLNEGQSLASFDNRVLHHEQVHSQQWSQYGWDFARRYIQDFVDSAGNANYNYWLYGPVQGVQVPALCFQYYERQAGFQDGGYAFRDPLHGGATSAATAGFNNRYVPNNQAYPTGWTTAINNGPNDYGTQSWSKCPSTWQPTTA